MVWHVSGASSANSGVQFTVAGQGGTFDEVAFRNAYKPAGHTTDNAGGHLAPNAIFGSCRQYAKSVMPSRRLCCVRARARDRDCGRRRAVRPDNRAGRAHDQVGPRHPAGFNFNSSARRATIG